MSKKKDIKVDQKHSKDLSKEKEFHPTPAMIVWLDTAVRLMTDNVKEIEREAKITEQSWYGWLKKDEFRLWFKQEWDKRLAGESWKLDTIGMKNAKRDHKYWQDMQRRVGNLKEEKGTTNNTIVIPILGPKTETIYVPQDNSDQQDPEA